MCFVSEFSGRLRIFPPHFPLRIPFKPSTGQEFLLGLRVTGGHDTDLPVSGGDLLVGDAVEFWELGWLWQAWRMRRNSRILRGWSPFLTLSTPAGILGQVSVGVFLSHDAEHGGNGIAPDVGHGDTKALGIVLRQWDYGMRRLPLPRLRMDEFGHKAEMARFRRDGILGEPDAVGEQRIATGIHDAVEGGIVGVGKKVETIFGSRLQDALHLDQGFGQFGCFRRTVILMVHDHSYFGQGTDKISPP